MIQQSVAPVYTSSPALIAQPQVAYPSSVSLIPPQQAYPSTMSLVQPQQSFAAAPSFVNPSIATNNIHAAGVGLAPYTGAAPRSTVYTPNPYLTHPQDHTPTCGCL